MKEPIDNYQLEDVLDLFVDSDDRFLDELTKDKSLSDLIDERYSLRIENLEAETTAGVGVPNFTENHANETNIVIYEETLNGDTVHNYKEKPCVTPQEFCQNYRIPKRKNSHSNINGLNGKSEINGVRKIIKKLPRREEFDKARKARKERINEEFIRSKAIKSIFRCDPTPAEFPIEKETLQVNNPSVGDDASVHNQIAVDSEFQIENDTSVDRELISGDTQISEQPVIDSPSQPLNTHSTVDEESLPDSPSTKEKDEVSVTENSRITPKLTVLLPRLPQKIIFEKTCIRNRRLKRVKRVSFPSELPCKTESYESFELQTIVKRQSTQSCSCSTGQNLSKELFEQVLRMVGEKLKSNFA